MNRYHFIDWAKTIGIFLVCIGHFIGNELAVSKLIYSFHVPLFFIIAGFLCKTEIDNPLKRIGTLFSRVFVPYICWFVVSALCLLPNLNLRVAKSIFLDFVMWDGLPIWNTPIWFLPVYFVACSIFNLLIWASGKLNARTRVAIVSIAAIVGFAVEIVFDLNGMRYVVFGLNKTAMMFGYVCTGFIFHRLFDWFNISQMPRKRSCACAAGGLFLFAATLALAYFFNCKDSISVLYCDFNNIFCYIPISIALCATFILSLLPLGECRIVSIISSSTLFIMGAHYFILKIWQAFVERTVLLDFLGGLLAFSLLFLLCLFTQKLSEEKCGKLVSLHKAFGLIPVVPEAKTVKN